MSTKNSQTLYLSKPILKLGGVDAPDDLMGDILEIVVDESLHTPSMFIIKIHNVYVAASENSKPWKNEKYFNIGDQISIGFEAATTEDPEFLSYAIEERLIEGEITSIEVKFANTSEAPIIVRGYDFSHRLHRGRYSRSFLNCTDTDIVRRVAEEARIRIGQLDASGVTHEYVFQENQTNMEFLRERAARIGFELFVQDKKLYFRKPKSGELLDLEWLKDIRSFDVKVTSAEQVSSVEVNSWDYSNKELISETASKEQLVTETGNGDGSSISQKFKMKQPPKMIVVDQPVDTPKEAKQMAQALCNELSGEFVTADAKAVGNPKIRPGKVVTLENMGTRYSGKYYVTGTCHRYIHRNYTTDFTVRGLREGSLLSTLPPKTHLQPGQTFLVGLVTNNNDPKGWGRVKVKFPTLTMKDESHWARVVGLGAGNERGFYCLPEIDDEVLVAFEHGDIHRPYIIGGVWNGKDKTVETVDDTVKNGQVRLRTIKTRTGHMVQFVEEDNSDSKAGIYITTTNGQCVHLNDSEGCIDIKTSGMINLNAQGELSAGLTLPSAINIEAAALPINISSLLGGINIESKVGPINIESAVGGINLASATKITMEAPVIAMLGAVTVDGLAVMVVPA
ncbi:VgrG-related protein [uncultured Nostoc sp.]|uniref:VgrG-related protein n=1 Tax=uncultured Nostoc sp. TaxID=340711 RepID=UPI0035CB9C6C